MTVDVDVAVAGGGPAGCAAAIVLATAGASVAVIERSTYDDVRLGETLPPEVRLPLERLGVWERFCADGHLPAPGIVAAWGHPEPYANDFILNPYGSGWRIDRTRFDTMLAEAAAAAGATVVRGVGLAGCVPLAGGGWGLTGERVDISARFLVDATGRASPLRRPLGGRRIVHDHLVALVGMGDAAPASESVDRRALIEATEEGWWYSALVPDGRVVAAFHTDAAAALRARWPRDLAAAPHTAARVGRISAATVRLVAASTQRTDPVAGAGWLAVGDAAAAHDPLCGLGIHWALESGIAGAGAVLAADGEAALAGYAAEARAHFDRYLAARAVYYGSEGRWPDAPFWRRRATTVATTR